MGFGFIYNIFFFSLKCTEFSFNRNAIEGARVIVSEPLEERRQKAIELGASAAIDPMNTNAVEEVLKLTNGRGAAVVYNTTATDAYGCIVGCRW